jgi:hypothetical protein
MCEIFLKITEIEIDKINDLLGVEHGWKPFYELCHKMTHCTLNNKQLDTDINVQRARDLLFASRKNLSTIAVLFIEKAAYLGPSRKLMAHIAKSDIELFDSMAKNFKKKKGTLKVQ